MRPGQFYTHKTKPDTLYYCAYPERSAVLIRWEPDGHAYSTPAAKATDSAGWPAEGYELANVDLSITDGKY